MPIQMPNDPITEQAEVRRKGRQRLIGAVVLALVAVVFVPMVLDPEPRRDRVEPLLAIPPKEGAAPLPAVTKAPEPPVERIVEVAGDGSAKPEAAKPEPAKAEPPKAPSPKAAAAPAAPKGETKAAAPKLEGFAVQVGAFRDEAKLAQARGKVSAARLPHYTEKLDAGDLTRLRAGPFPTREAAEKAAAQLKRAGLGGQVVPLP